MPDQTLRELSWAAAGSANIALRGDLCGYVRPPFDGEWETLTDAAPCADGKAAAVVVREIGQNFEKIAIQVAPDALLDPSPEWILAAIDKSLGTQRRPQQGASTGAVGHA